ncbi:MAG: hypothetical protein ACE148_14325 [Vicinamibacterales bacterium]
MRNLTALQAVRTAAAAGCILLGSSCSRARLELPSGPATAFEAYASAFSQASEFCRSVRALTVDLSISGRAGGERLRGTVIAGLQEPGSLRLEGVSPFGAPAFVLVASGGNATLLLPRDGRVLTGVAPEDVLEAIAGIPLDPDDLRAMLSGCVVADPQPASGRLYENGWARVDLGRDSAAYLRRETSGWRIAAGTVGRFSVEYRLVSNRLPGEVLVWEQEPGEAATELRVRLNEPEINGHLGQQAFTVKVPPEAEPMSLDDLRRGGPLGSRRK